MGKDINILSYSPSELGSMLCGFFGSVKTKNNQNYSKSGLISIRAGIQRFLKDNNSIINITIDREFSKSNLLLEGLKKEMKRNGEDRTKHKTAISQDDIQKMYDTRNLNNTDPVGLQRKIFFELSLHCGRRGKEGLRELRKESFQFTGEGESLKAELKYNEVDKNHQGGGDNREKEKQQVDHHIGL